MDFLKTIKPYGDQFVPVHIHPTQDEFILVQEGVLDLKLVKWGPAPEHAKQEAPESVLAGGVA